jgi:zinc protease
MVHETTLENGLTLLVQEVHTAPLASVWCWYKVGSRDEGPGVTGVSHWVEHMMFKGTTNIPRDQVKGIIEQFGGSWNGYTWIDQTTYLETATRDALDRMLFIEAERMASCLYVRGLRVGTHRHHLGAAGRRERSEQRLDAEITATAFKAHSYRHPTIGWLSDLKTMTREDLYGHYRRYYVPNNATLVVVGDVDTADVVRRVQQQFGGIVSGVPARRLTTVRRRRTGNGACTCASRHHGLLAVVFHAPAFMDPDFFPLLALDAMLTGASGLNIWSGGGVATPQRSARLYRGLGTPASPRRWAVSRRRRAVPLFDCRHGRARPVDCRRRNGCAHECARLVADGPRPQETRSAGATARAASSMPAASPTWRTSSATSRRSRAGATGPPSGTASPASRPKPSTPRPEVLVADNRTIGIFEPTPGESEAL